MGFFKALIGGIGGALIGGPVGALAGAGIGLSLEGNSQARKAYRHQLANIEEQKRLNKEVAAFNIKTLNEVYPKTTSAIKLETRNALARQMMAFGAAGAAPGSASPFFVLGDISYMGAQRLQEAKFNRDVDLKNEDFRAKGAINDLDSQSYNARYQIKKAGLATFSDVLSGAGTLYNAFRYGNPFSVSSGGTGLNSAPLFNGKMTG